MLRQKLTLFTVTALVLMSGLQATLGLPWLVVNMKPKEADGLIELGTLTGAELVPAVAALTPVMWLGVVVALLLKQRVWIGYLMISILAGLATASIASYLSTGDTSAVQDRLAGWTNIAAAHDVTDLTVVRSSTEWLGLAAGILALIGFSALVFYSLNFKRQLGKAAVQKPRQKSGVDESTSQPVTPSDSEEPDDPISMWDAQRPKN